MTDIDRAGTFTFGDRAVRRMGYGAMQLAGPMAYGPPKDRATAIAVLRRAVEAGVNHIDTSDYYGPFVVNDIIREALHPYPDDLALVSKIGAVRGEGGSWLPAMSKEQLTQAVHDNLKRLGVERLHAINLRAMFSPLGPAEGSLDEPLEVLADLQRQGLVRHVGLSNVTPKQVADGRAMCAIACVQNHYNLVRRVDDAMIDELAAAGIAYVPFFPLGGFSPLQSDALSTVAADLGATPMQVALAWLLRRASNILLIPGTSSLGHLKENLAAASLELPDESMTALNAIGG
jgi:pyridoxine 4-dehydrogenase